MTGDFPEGFQWDDEKNRANIEKHGIDFRDAILIFRRPTLDRADGRHRYGEDRINSIGDLDGRIIVNVTHTDRAGIVRVISARLANRAERDRYLRFRASLGEDPVTPASR